MVNYLDLQAQYHGIKDEIQEALNRVLDSSQYVLGKEVASFEEDFASYCQVEHCVAVNSGTSALHLALLAAGIGQGDEVITVPNTFVATVAAILYTGATPVLVDINPESLNIDVTKIENAITDRTKAILPVHLFGQTADMDPILTLAKKYDLFMIEDAAQAHGAEYKNRRAGSIGDFGCFSFYPGKNLGAYGEGGALVTNNQEFAHKARVLRDWGAEEKYHHKYPGYNYRMDGFQGAVLGVKLRYLEKWIEARRACANKYNHLLKEIGIKTPIELTHNRHVYHIYAIRVSNRDDLQKYLKENSIYTGIHYPIPVHLQPAYANMGYKEGDFPVAEAIAKELLSLPLYAELPEEDIESVVNAINEFQN